MGNWITLFTQLCTLLFQINLSVNEIFQILIPIVGYIGYFRFFTIIINAAVSILVYKLGKAFFNFEEDVLGNFRTFYKCLLCAKLCAVVSEHYLNPVQNLMR